MAKHHFDVPRTIARVNNPRNEALFRHLGVDEIISPTRMALAAIEQDIPVHHLLHLAQLGGGEVELLEAQIETGSPLIGQRPPATLTCRRAAPSSASSGTSRPGAARRHGVRGWRQGARARADRLRAGAPPRPHRGSDRGGRLLSEFDPDAFEPDATPPHGIPIVEPETAAQLLGAARTTSSGQGHPVVPPRRRPAAEPATAGADPGRALARSLLVWGAGLIWLGEPIGWLLAVLEVLWIIALRPLDRPAADGRVDHLLPPRSPAFIVIWVGQAIWAYRVARRISVRTREPPGCLRQRPS